MTMVIIGVIIGSIIAICWTLFILYPLEVGRCRYFMESRQSLTPPSTVVSVFRYPYGNPIVVQLLTDLKIALGYFLLIVPGIYWTYCYMLVPYLLAENPYMTATRAMELSKEMMYGEKWKFFVLQLSFFGWLLLCALTLGIGGFFLEPYMQATYAEFYAAMRSKALAQGFATTDELGGFVRHDASRIKLSYRREAGHVTRLRGAFCGRFGFDFTLIQTVHANFSHFANIIYNKVSAQKESAYFD